MFHGVMFPRLKKYWVYEVIKMKKKIISRILSGMVIGIVIGYIISILISLIWANGYYSPCVPELKAVMGSEINAVMFQTALCALLGAGFSAASLIWQKENWSIVKQTGIYFSVISVIMMPIAYLTYWMEHSVAGFFSYFAVFALIFVVVWIVQFTVGKQNVKKMNKQLKRE